MTTRSYDLIPSSGNHAGRPATAPKGAVYSCTTHGLIYRYDSGWTTWAVLVPPGGTTGQVLGKTSGTDYAVGWSTASGGSSVKDRAWVPGSSETSIDEFNDASLDAAWVRVDSAGASRATWTENADVLSVYNSGGDAAVELHAMMRPLSGAGGSLAAGDGFVTAMRIHSPRRTNLAAGGLLFADGITYGSGQQITANVGYNTSGLDIDPRSISGYSTFNSQGTLASFIEQPVYIRLAMIATNSYRIDTSADGVSWIPGTAFSRTITPTHVGFHDSSYGTSTKSVISYEFLRRVSGIT